VEFAEIHVDQGTGCAHPKNSREMEEDEGPRARTMLFTRWRSYSSHLQESAYNSEQQEQLEALRETRDQRQDAVAEERRQQDISSPVGTRENSPEERADHRA